MELRRHRFLLLNISSLAPSLLTFENFDVALVSPYSYDENLQQCLYLVHQTPFFPSDWVLLSILYP